MKIPSIILSLVGFFALFITACGDAGGSASVKKGSEPTLPETPGSQVWTTDFQAGLAQAAKEDKMVLIDFLGSDWCPPCIEMVRTTFSKPEFLQFAEKNLVLVELDFPMKKPQPMEMLRANRRVADQFGVRGFPTMVLLNSQGKEIARHVGYLPGGPAALEEWVKAAQVN